MQIRTKATDKVTKVCRCGKVKCFIMKHKGKYLEKKNDHGISVNSCDMKRIAIWYLFYYYDLFRS